MLSNITNNNQSSKEKLTFQSNHPGVMVSNYFKIYL